MKVIGVSKTRPNAEAFVAKQRGYPLYIADISKKAAFEKAISLKPSYYDKARENLRKAESALAASPRVP